MMDYQVLEDLLADTFEDTALDNQEKSQLRTQTATLGVDQLRFARNKAFALAREKLNQTNADSIKVLKWLEQVIKTLDSHQQSAPQSQVFFSPEDQCWRHIVDFCQQAQKSLDICVFTISDDRITKAILAAHERGIAVRIITDNDKVNDAGSDIDFLRSKGIPVATDRSTYHMHHKFALVDNHCLLNGSFNWTRSASEYNEENFSITKNARLAGDFSQQFEKLWRRFY